MSEQSNDYQISPSRIIPPLLLTMVPWLYGEAYSDAPCYKEIEYLDDRGEIRERQDKISDGACYQIKGQEAFGILRDALRETETLHDIDASVINFRNTTAILLYRPEQHTVMVAFNATQTFGDKIDGFFRFAPTDHALGGRVHRGFYRDFVKPLDGETLSAENLTALMEGVLHDYADRVEDRPLTVDFTGFCSGGAKAVLAAGEMIHNGFFETPDQIHLGDIYTFGSVGYAESAFVQAIEDNIKRLDGNLWEVQLHGDSLSNLMTKEGWVVSRPMGYEQAGTHLYLVPDLDGNGVKMLINPDQDIIARLPDNDLDMAAAHRPEPYEAVLRALIGDTPTPEMKTEGKTYEIPQNCLIREYMLEGL